MAILVQVLKLIEEVVLHTTLVHTVQAIQFQYYYQWAHQQYRRHYLDYHLPLESDYPKLLKMDYSFSQLAFQQLEQVIMVEQLILKEEELFCHLYLQMDYLVEYMIQEYFS